MTPLFIFRMNGQLTVSAAPALSRFYACCKLLRILLIFN